MTGKRKTVDPFADLSWADLNRWAGSKIVGRGRGYQNDGAVEDLARTPGGGLIAWVDGTRRYAVHVERDSRGELLSACTCPYEATCKHAAGRAGVPAVPGKGDTGAFGAQGRQAL